MAVKQSDVPLMRASVIRVFLARLNEKQKSAILERLSMSQDDLDNEDQFIAAETGYSVADWCAELTQDPDFGFRTGISMNVLSWPPFRDARQSKTLAELLTRFAAGVSQHATSTRYAIDLGPATCTFRQSRLFRPSIRPVQADAFNLGLIIKILSTVLGRDWDQSMITVEVCEPSAIKALEISGEQKLPGHRMGVSIQFPSEWLWTECNLDIAYAEGHVETSKHLPSGVGEVVEMLLKSKIPIAEATTSRIAEFLKVSPRNLRTRLARKGISLAKVIDDAKRDRAVALLEEHGMSVSDAAAAMGYADAANFTRAFKRLTGLSPSDFRKRASKH